MIPVVSIVGIKSKVGKTTVICKIISELKNRGYKVGVIKHDVHGSEIDHPGKDTWLHAQVGADVVSISSHEKMAIIEKVEREYSLDEMIGKINNVDIILTEGYKQENKPKIEVFRKDVSEELYSKEEDLIAIITDTYFELDIPQFSFSKVDKIVDLLERKFSLRKGD